MEPKPRTARLAHQPLTLHPRIYAQRSTPDAPLTRPDMSPLRISHHCSLGGILSPLMANIALSVLDEHLQGPWRPGGTMSTPSRRARRRSKGQPTWRVVRYADDFAVLVHGKESDVHDLRAGIAQVLATMGLVFSEAKTSVIHMSEGFDFLGFRIQWRRKMGTNKWHVYTFVADRPVRSLKAKIRAATRTRKRY
jgi:RNA-directed DNA polymerase